MFGLFSKKEADRLKKTLIELEQNTGNAFLKVKTDMSTISRWLAYFKKTESAQNQQIQHLQNEINYLKNLVNQSHSIKKTEEYLPLAFEVESKEYVPKNSTAELTTQQKQLLYVICSLHNEKRDWVSLQEISRELYHDRDYNSIRTTLLEYSSLLEEFGLISKKRKGKRLILSLTSKGKKLADSLKKEANIRVRKKYK